ncbi:MAG: RagB/SusD family nutrient uptake outer membrane protein [Bacteroidales bacterium]|nr:RagB/SusD family nutrient uptake outer membrane protein [Bacteroidales bacterium]
MKKYIVLPIIILVLLGSCENYLEFPPEGEIPQEQFFNSQDDAQQAVNAMYGYLRFWNISAFSYLILGSLPSDEILKGSSPGDGSWANDYDNFLHTKTQGQIKDFWTGRYEGINLSNQVISNIPDIEMNAGLKSRMIAEATFMRAFHYYYLVRAYGGVPLIKEVPAGPEGLVRTSLEETWDFIESDLRAAIPDLPETVPSNELGRATKWAAKGLLAKVLMYRQDWSECKSVSDDIINNGPFDLYPDFYQLYRPEQEFCQESLFEIVATQVPGEGGLSNSQFAETQAVRGQFGWGWFVPTDELADAFDAAGDTVRKKVTILFKGDVTDDGDLIEGIDVMEGVELPRYNGKVYVPTRIERVTGPYGCDQNVRILRFADILLINAEAAIHAGGDAANPLNRVRARANLDPIGSPTIEDIWEERRLELAGEQDRYWDLLRTGQAASVLSNKGFQSGKHELYPIPQIEIDLSGDQLEQNPGW